MQCRPRVLNPADSYRTTGVPPNDPRFNLVGAPGREGLQETGAAWPCRSQWGSDFLYDMVGNLNEWVDGTDAILVGGHYGHDVRGRLRAQESAPGRTRVL